ALIDEDTEELRAAFAEELRGRVAALSALLDRLAVEPPGPARAEVERGVFAEAHRLKGAAGTLLLGRLAAVAGELAATFGGEGAGGCAGDRARARPASRSRPARPTPAGHGRRRGGRASARRPGHRGHTDRDHERRRGARRGRAVARRRRPRVPPEAARAEAPA